MILRIFLCAYIVLLSVVPVLGQTKVTYNVKIGRKKPITVNAFRINERDYCNFALTVKKIFPKAKLSADKLSMMYNGNTIRSGFGSLYLYHKKATKKNEQTRMMQMPYPALQIGSQLYVPIVSFFSSFEKFGMYRVSFNQRTIGLQNPGRRKMSSTMKEFDAIGDKDILPFNPASVANSNKGKKSSMERRSSFVSLKSQMASMKQQNGMSDSDMKNSMQEGMANTEEVAMENTKNGSMEPSMQSMMSDEKADMMLPEEINNKVFADDAVSRDADIVWRTKEGQAMADIPMGTTSMTRNSADIPPSFSKNSMSSREVPTVVPDRLPSRVHNSQELFPVLNVVENPAVSEMFRQMPATTTQETMDEENTTSMEISSSAPENPLLSPHRVTPAPKKAPRNSYVLPPGLRVREDASLQPRSSSSEKQSMDGKEGSFLDPRTIRKSLQERLQYIPALEKKTSFQLLLHVV